MNESHPEAVAAAMACLDAYLAAYDAGDVAAFDATFNFPALRMEGKTLQEVKPGGNARMFEQNPPPAYGRSTWARREVLEAAADKVRIATRFERQGDDGRPIGTAFDATYVVTCEGGHWGIKARLGQQF